MEEEKVRVPEKFKKLVDEIEKMSVVELSELTKILEKKFGVSAASMAVPLAPAPSTSSGQAAGEVEGTVSVILASGGDQKIQVIKALREIDQNIGLKEAKDLVDGAPKPIKEGISRKDAEEIKKKLEAAGAKVEIK